MVTLGAGTDPVDEVGVEEKKKLFNSSMFSARDPVRKGILAGEKQQIFINISYISGRNSRMDKLQEVA